jgi:FkbM family methyltransferase
LQADLIFDIGMHIGVDTRYYLERGFRVVAVEANPKLAEQGSETFSEAISTGKLVIENVGITDTSGVLNFYVNHSVDEWSSFTPHLGQRKGKYSEIAISTITLAELVQKHGMPHYLKIDVEGFDSRLIRQLAKIQGRPGFVSIEDGGIESMVALYEAGVRKFKFSNQLDIQTQVRNPAGELFGVSSSGPFGDDLPGSWLAAHEAFAQYVANIRRPGQEPERGWWDIHGKFLK